MTDAFANEPIDVDDLPQLRDEAFTSVDPRYLRASLIGISITAAVVALVGAAVASQSDRPLAVIAVVVAILVLLAVRAVFRTLEVRRLAYQVRAHDLSMRSGVITHRTSSLPFVRVQHVRIHRGAIERALGLATLHVSSAGPNITIPGLADATAERIKLLVTERAGDLDETTDEPSTESILAPGPSHAAPAPPPPIDDPRSPASNAPVAPPPPSSQAPSSPPPPLAPPPPPPAP